MSKSEGLMYNMATIVDNIVLYNWNLLRVELERSHQKKKKKVNMISDGYVS